MAKANVLTELTSALASGGVEIIDLTQVLSEDTPTLQLPPEFNQAAGFSREELSRYDERGVAWYWNNFTVCEHTGTHFDAPAHWVTGKDLDTVDTMPAKDFVAPAVVLDFSKECAQDADFLLTAEHIRAWEAEHGQIPAGSWVFFRSDWSKLDVEAYTNRREDGAHTPGPAVDAVELMNERQVLGFGVETIGTDPGQGHLLDPPFPAHTLLHQEGRYGLQCMENLDLLPPTGAVIIASPLKILDGSGSPLRVIALVAK